MKRALPFLGAAVGLLGGRLIGGVSNHLIGAAVPALLVLLLVPPWVAAQLDVRGALRFMVPHLVAVGIAIYLGWGAHVWVDALLFVLLDGGSMYLASRPRAGAGATLGLAVFLGLGSGVGFVMAAEPCPQRDPPRLSVATASVARAIQPAVRELERFAFDELSEGEHTDALLIVRRGVILYERYERGFGRKTPHITWSISKSVTATLLGVAVERGYVALDDSICDHLDAPARLCGVQVGHLLEFSSGLDWRETYEDEGAPQDSSVLAMLYGEGRTRMTRFVLSHPLRAPPGTTWMYSSGDTQLLMAVVRRAIEPAAGPRFPWSVLFEPLGMSSAVFERDGAGDYVGASYFYASARDLARLGQLYLRDGCWGDRRLLPSGWAQDTGEVTDVFRVAAVEPEAGYVGGRHWWQNEEAAGLSKPMPAAPNDAFAARGHWGQSLLVIPSLDALVVRLGEDRHGARMNYARLIEHAMDVVRAQP